MYPPSAVDNIREWIAGIAWRLYLWGARLTEDQFLAEHKRQALQQLRSEEEYTEAQRRLMSVGSMSVGALPKTYQENHENLWKAFYAGMRWREEHPEPLVVEKGDHG
jgi:hypothetical protein